MTKQNKNKKELTNLGRASSGAETIVIGTNKQDWQETRTGRTRKAPADGWERQIKRKKKQVKRTYKRKQPLPKKKNEKKHGKNGKTRKKKKKEKKKKTTVDKTTDSNRVGRKVVITATKKWHDEVMSY